MKLLVVDGHPLLRDAFERLLRHQYPSAEILAVGSCEEARAALLQSPADLVVTDLLCRHSTGPKGLEEMVGAAAPGRIIAFGECSGQADAVRAQAAGVHGYVPASSPPELVAAAIGLVLAGGVYFPQLPLSDQRGRAKDGRHVERLTDRQRVVLQGLRAGQSNKAIARTLGISVATVKLHVQGILRNVGARNRTEAAARYADDPDGPESVASN
jgi:DNA-binding NarL/FixJ family response regulator